MEFILYSSHRIGRKSSLFNPHFAAVFLYSFLSLACFAISPLLAAAPTGQIFHFDFRNAAGQKEIVDTSGRFKCLSRVGPFVIEDGALRVAEGAQILIPDDGLPDLTHDLTISLWVAKGYFGDTPPLLFKGTHPQPIQFFLSVKGNLPQFTYKNEPNQAYWKGLYADGSDYGSSQRYPTDEWKVAGSNHEVTAGLWTHLVVTFNQGNIRVYNNGKLTLSKSVTKPELLQANDQPIWIGADRLGKETNNFTTANARLNDLRLYDRVLSPEEVEALHAAEAGKYPKENLIPQGKVTLPPSSAYLEAIHPEYDPDFLRKLPLTAAYEKKLSSLKEPEAVSSSRVITRGGSTDLLINDRKVTPQMVIPLLTRDNQLHLDEVFGVDRDFAAAGIDLVNTGFIGPTFWLGEGKYDWAQLDSTIETALQANPRAQVMLNLFLRPHAWWFDAHLDEMERYLDASGTPRIWYTSAPLSSELWLQSSLKMIRDVVTHVETSPYGKRVFGYHMSGGDAGEWYWAGSFTGGMPGYSKATERGFQQWLTTKYKADTALKTAWNDPAVTLVTAKVPSPAARTAAEYGVFRIPQQAQAVYDLRDYLNDITYRNIEETCRTVKEASGSKKVVCIYYGYPVLYAGKASTMHKGGLQMLGKVLRCPSIDWIATPLDYVHRRGGEPGLNINAFNGSARLHNKMLWHENDLRTYLHPKLEFGRTSDIDETLSVIDRGFGYALTLGAGIWWNTLAGNGTFHEERTMQRIARINQAASKASAVETKPVAQVAFFFDEKTGNHTGVPKNDFLDNTTWAAYENAAKMGAPFDFYLLDDIDNWNMPQYKLYVFLNVFSCDEAMRRKIEKKVHANNAVAVWCYAPGFITQDGFSTAAMEELTGIKIEKEDAEKAFKPQVKDTAHLITRGVTKVSSFTVAPWFRVADEKANVLVTSDDAPIMATKEFPQWRSVYSLAPLSAELLTGLCDYAGVHVYSRSMDVLSANRDYLMLHTSASGKKTISLPQKSNVFEVLSGRKIASGAVQFEVEAKAGETLIYRLMPLAKQ